MLKTALGWIVEAAGIALGSYLAFMVARTVLGLAAPILGAWVVLLIPLVIGLKGLAHAACATYQCASDKYVDHKQRKESV